MSSTDSTLGSNIVFGNLSPLIITFKSFSPSPLFNEFIRTAISDLPKSKTCSCLAIVCRACSLKIKKKMLTIKF